MQRSNRKGPSQRQLRVGEQMRHLIAEILQRGELHDPALEGAGLIVSEVRVSPDLRHATVFAAELGRDLQEKTRERLARHGSSLGVRLAKEMHLKYAPRVKFVADQSFAEASHIEELIDRERAALTRTHDHAGHDAGREGSGDG
jgi:ribosome-binding factor A